MKATTAFMSKVHFSIAFINSLTTLPQSIVSQLTAQYVTESKSKCAARGGCLSCHRVLHEPQAVKGNVLSERRVKAEQMLLVAGVDVGVCVKVVGMLDGGQRDGVGLTAENGREGPYVADELRRAVESVAVGPGVEWHADGVEDEGHVQPGVGGAACGGQMGVGVKDVVGHEGRTSGEAAALCWGAGFGRLVCRSSAAGEPRG